jgi:ribosomal protein L32
MTERWEDILVETSKTVYGDQVGADKGYSMGFTAQEGYMAKKLARLEDLLDTARENVGLRHCSRCGHLHMPHHICYSCGHDDSYDAEDDS